MTLVSELIGLVFEKVVPTNAEDELKLNYISRSKKDLSVELERRMLEEENIKKHGISKNKDTVTSFYLD